MKMLAYVAAFAVCVGCIPIYLDPTRSIGDRIDDLINNMTLEEKVGQMVEVVDTNKTRFFGEHIGSTYSVVDDGMRQVIEWVSQTRLKIPVLSAHDAVHGYGRWNGSTIFPTPLGAAQSWDEELIEMMGNVTAYEMRYTGVAWTFAPVMCIGRELRWGRVGETFGEDPYLLGRLGVAIVYGFQGHNGVTSDPDKVLACPKHYAGYSETFGGRDASESENSRRKLRSWFLPPFEAVMVKGKAGSIMAAYESIDGTPCCMNEWLLRKVLKEEWLSSALVLTDWDDLTRLIDGQRVAANMSEAAILAINGGSDMMMVTEGFYNATVEAVRRKELDEKIVEQAVRRQLKLKFAMGLFENPRMPDAAKQKERASSPFSRAQAQKLAEESLVLLKNDGILPLDIRALGKLAVVGPNADNAGQQNGDWTDGQPRENSITIVDGFREKVLNVEYQKGCGIDPHETGDLPAAIAAINSSDAAVVVIGDRGGFYGERHSVATLELQGGQKEFLAAIIATKRKFILVVLSQKPLVIDEEIRKAASAIIWQFCPGQLGGRALARAVLGEVNPSGKLTISIPEHVGQQPMAYYMHRYRHGFYKDAPWLPAFAFGSGMGYSPITYVNASLDKATYRPGENIHVSVLLRNEGKYDADEIVQVYMEDVTASVTWVQKQLKGFKRQHIAAGTNITSEIIIPVDDLWLINAAEERVVEPGAFVAHISPSSASHAHSIGFRVE
jgi:beta-glucosidase